MKAKRKGFTIFELIMTISLLIVVFLIVVGTIYTLKGQSTDKYIRSLGDNILLAGEDYFTSNRTKLPVEVGQTKAVELETLIDQNYIEPLKAGYESCVNKETNVYATKNSNNTYDYSIILKCGDDELIKGDLPVYIEHTEIDVVDYNSDYNYDKIFEVENNEEMVTIKKVDQDNGSYELIASHGNLEWKKGEKSNISFKINDYDKQFEINYKAIKDGVVIATAKKMVVARPNISFGSVTAVQWKLSEPYQLMTGISVTVNGKSVPVKDINVTITKGTLNENFYGEKNYKFPTSGEYLATYKYVYNLVEVTVNRTIKVYDIPTIKVTPTSVGMASGQSVNVLSGVTGTDTFGQSTTVKASNNLNVSSVGRQTITYYATDVVGNVSAPATRTYTVYGTPSISMSYTTKSICTGTSVNVKDGVSASDSILGSISVSAYPASLSIYSAGNQYVTYSASNGYRSTSRTRTYSLSSCYSPPSYPYSGGYSGYSGGSSSSGGGGGGGSYGPGTTILDTSTGNIYSVNSGGGLTQVYNSSWGTGGSGMTPSTTLSNYNSSSSSSRSSSSSSSSSRSSSSSSSRSSSSSSSRSSSSSSSRSSSSSSSSSKRR